MNSLEKSMFFLPNRFYLDGHRIFVSFNIVPIPRDMGITRMLLKVDTHPHVTADLMLQVYQLTSGWDTNIMSTGYQPSKTLTQRVPILPGQKEVEVDITPFAQPWRNDSLNNHGLALLFPMQHREIINHSTPPYLIVDTL